MAVGSEFFCCDVIDFAHAQIADAKTDENRELIVKTLREIDPRGPADNERSDGADVSIRFAFFKSWRLAAQERTPHCHKTRYNSAQEKVYIRPRGT